MSDLRLARVELQASPAVLPALAGFYADLGLDQMPDELAFTPASSGEPYYHFAFLVPGDRFEAAHAWAGERAGLLLGKDGGTVFPFGFWDATACYFHDPAGNIVELIAHHGMGERGQDGAFAPGELLGISELGVVSSEPVDTVRELGLDAWSGSAAEGLGFVGRKAHTLIVAAAGRGWLPTGRPAQPFPVDVTVTGAGEAREVRLPESGSRVTLQP